MAEAVPVRPCGEPGAGLWDKIDCYCERAGSPDFWAEPLNALSNLAFIVAALAAYVAFRGAAMPAGRPQVAALIALMVVIGAGSFLFHTVATPWAAMADVIPIGVFVFAYVVLAYRWFVGAPLWAAFTLALVVTGATFAMPPWFNGSAMYAPSLAVMAGTGLVLRRRGHAAAGRLLVAAGVFAVSLTLRSLDRLAAVCEPHHIGTHWAWHVLNAVTLYLLVRAAIANPPAGVCHAA